MKKAISIALVLAMCLLCSCGKSEKTNAAVETVSAIQNDGKSKNATECENLISTIGKVNIDSGEAIETAEKAYNALTDEEKESIAESAAVLEEARSRFIFEISKEAYHEIKTANSIIHSFGSNIYDAWLLGATEPATIQKDGVAFLVSNVALSEEEIKGGLGYFKATWADEKDWNVLTETEKQQYIDDADSFLKGVSNSNVLELTIYTIPYAYIVNGKTEEAQNMLDNAKKLMRQLSEKYSDYEHYPKLKGYYTTTCSFFEFCQNPKGTFTMLETTLNDYMNNVRDYSSDLDFIFEN